MQINIQLKRTTHINAEQSNTHSDSKRIKSAKSSVVANQRGFDQPNINSLPYNFQLPPVSGRGGNINLE
eukprot:2955538-Heterocapsa_arctica.AAC.1